MPNLSLSLATCDYDHVRDLMSGVVRAQGIDITPMVFDEPHYIFHRATNFGDFDVSEMSFGRYVSLVSRRKNDMVAIPVFPSRMARMSAFYVPKGSRVKKPEDLKGATVGIPEWTQTATIYARGWLENTVGVDLRSIKWLQTGVDVPGRPEPQPPRLPKGVKVKAVTDKSLSDLLNEGSVDCVISALEPKPVRDGSPNVSRLIKNYHQVEIEYFKDTGIFPIMHVIAIKRSVLEAHPWVAANLYEAFTEAKDRALERAFKGSHAIYPVPWAVDAARDAKKLFGDDIWPYGIEPNRPTLEAFLKFSYQQGVAYRKLKPEDLFAEQTLEAIKT
ncbi:MAG: 4,5-dihydroxyphthalate decarboxylase [Rhodospirillales bacterium]|nr:4,5-dihydroxyphthalate decarboxylase [Rhodospirillales bacterium]